MAEQEKPKENESSEVIEAADISKRRIEYIPIQTNKPRSRIVVVESVVHQTPGDDPIVVEARFSRWLESGEQPFIRRMYLEQDWRKLEIGWIKSSSMLMLTNEPDMLVVRPSAEVQAIQVEKIIEVAILPQELVTGMPRDMHSPPRAAIQPLPFSYILPGESIRICPTDAGSIVLRARAGCIKCNVSLFPN